MPNLVLNLKPEVRGVAVVTRNGVVVGKVPLASPPGVPQQKRADDDGAEKSESSSSASAEEDPV